MEAIIDMVLLEFIFYALVHGHTTLGSSYIVRPEFVVTLRNLIAAEAVPVVKIFRSRVLACGSSPFDFTARLENLGKRGRAFADIVVGAARIAATKTQAERGGIGAVEMDADMFFTFRRRLELLARLPIEQYAAHKSGVGAMDEKVLASLQLKDECLLLDAYATTVPDAHVQSDTRFLERIRLAALTGDVSLDKTFPAYIRNLEPLRIICPALLHESNEAANDDFAAGGSGNGSGGGGGGGSGGGGGGGGGGGDVEWFDTGYI